jgi:PAS domain S-box-containing protein
MSNVPLGLQLPVQTNLEQYRRFVEQAGHVFFQTDLQGVWTFLNPAWERITGFSINKSLGTNLCTYVYPNDRQRSRELLQAIVAGRRLPGRYELRYLTRDHGFRWMQMDIGIDRTADGLITGLSGTLSDISESKQYEMSARLLQTLIQAIIEAPDFNSALQVTLCQVCETTGWDYGEVWVKSAEQKPEGYAVMQLSPIWYGKTQRLMLFRQLSQAYLLPIDQSLPGRVWLTQQPEWIPDVSHLSIQEFARAPIAEEAGLRASFGVPIVADGEVLAVLAFFMLAAHPEDLQKVELITAVAKQLGSVMQSKQAADALRQAEENYRSIVENAREGIFQVMADGSYRSVNPALTRMLGYDSPAQLIQASSQPGWRLYVDPDRHREFITLLMQRTIIADFESEVYRQDGSIIWVSAAARTVCNANGNLEYFEGTLIDITERKQAESSLATTLSLMQATLDSISDGVIAVDLHGNLVSYNQKFIDMWGIPEQVLGDPQQHLLFLAAQVIEPDSFLERVQELYDQPDAEGWDVLECQDGRVFERYSRPQWLGSTIVGRVWDYRDITQRKQAELALIEQQQQSERLLLNILPAPIAHRLKQSCHSIADNFPEATVMFADLVNFTAIADNTHPEALVELLNHIFSRFDRLAAQHGLEKIKTIGDAYMVVGGLPIPRPDHVEAIADLALALQQAIQDISIELEHSLTLRIGIHTGSVVAGVIGITKLSYDLWGDAVNIASRMESQGLPGQIQVSSAVYDRLKQNYHMEERGCIPVKGKGDMQTYLLLGKKQPSDR